MFFVMISSNMNSRASFTCRGVQEDAQYIFSDLITSIRR